MWVPGATRRAAVKAEAARLAQMRRELELRRRAEEELAAREARPPARRMRALRSLLFRGRRVLQPFVLLAALWLGPLFAQPSAPLAVPTVWMLAAGGWWVVRGRRRLDRAVEHRYAAACVVGGAVWLLLPLAPALLVLGWAAASLPWWQHHWPRPTPAAPAPAPAPAVEPVEQRWEENIAATGRALPGSDLYAHELTAVGDAWAVQAVPGAAGQQMGAILGKLPQIAQGLRVPQHRVVIDDHPGTEDPSVFRLQIIQRSPIEQPVFFDQPRWKGGSVLLGPHADGDGDALWRVYTDNSMWGGFLLGGTGSGKSRLLEAIAVTVRAMSAGGLPTVILYLDGQDGASSPMLWQHATWRGGPADSNALLCGLERGLAMRQKWNRVFGLSGFTPGGSPDGGRTPGLPGVLVIIDEQHRIFNPHNGLRWANFAREARKVGMAAIGADQYSDLEAFGNKDALRSSLLAGNGLAMRTQSNTAGDLIPGVTLKPSEFPELPGYGYKIAAPASGERTAPFRGRWLPAARDLGPAVAQGSTVKEWDLSPAAARVLTVEEWFARTADAELDEMTARAFGSIFTDRHRLAEEATLRARAEIEGRELISLVKPAAARPIVAPAVEDQVDEGTARDKVLALLADGAKNRADLIAASGYSESSVKQALTALVRGGMIKRSERGVYVRVEATIPAA